MSSMCASVHVSVCLCVSLSVGGGSGGFSQLSSSENRNLAHLVSLDSRGKPTRKCVCVCARTALLVNYMSFSLKTCDLSRY